MIIFYFLVAILFNVVQGIVNKTASIRLKSSKDYTLLILYRMMVSFFISVVVSLFSLNAYCAVNGRMFLYAGLFAGSFILNIYCNLYAVQRGTIVLYNVFNLSGMFLPCVYSWLFLDEPFGPWKLGGILLLLIGMAVSCLYNSCQMGKLRFGTLVCCILGCLSNGAVMTVQKVFAVYEIGQSVTVFNAVAFGICTLIMLFIALALYIARHKSELSPQPFAYGSLWLPILVLGGTVFILSQTMTILAGMVNASLLYPTVTGCALAVLAVVSAFIFKEKLRISSFVSIGFTIAGIVFLNI